MSLSQSPPKIRYLKATNECKTGPVRTQCENNDLKPLQRPIINFPLSHDFVFVYWKSDLFITQVNNEQCPRKIFLPQTLSGSRKTTSLST